MLNLCRPVPNIQSPHADFSILQNVTLPFADYEINRSKSLVRLVFELHEKGLQWNTKHLI